MENRWKGDFQCALGKWDGEDNDENDKEEDGEQIFITKLGSK